MNFHINKSLSLPSKVTFYGSFQVSHLFASEILVQIRLVHDVFEDRSERSYADTASDHNSHVVLVPILSAFSVGTVDPELFNIQFDCQYLNTSSAGISSTHRSKTPFLHRVPNLLSPRTHGSYVNGEISLVRR